jgi:hypothetical protein
VTVKILYWNVQDFTNNKIANGLPPPHAAYGYAGAGQGPERLAYMIDTFSTGALPGPVPFIPDFIVVVEIEKGGANVGPGYPVIGNAATGVIGLLNAINANATLIGGGRHWSLVPPLSLGRKGQGEGIAVFYNDTAWRFMGPQSRGAAYLAPFAGALPNRRIPVGYPLGRGNQWEDRLQGQWFYTSRKRVRFGNPSSIKFPFRNSRPPWLTYFGSVALPATLVRLMSIHTQPLPATTPIAATRAISYVTGMMNNAWEAAQQIDVILGDFNVNNLAAASWAAGGAFAHFVGTDAVFNANPVYTPAVRAPAGLNVMYNDYYRTESPPLADCEVENGGAISGQMPGYDYLIRSIDNVFYRTHGVAAPPAAARSTIVNRATGTPYPAAAGAPVPAPYRGAVTYAPTMATPIATIIANVLAAPAVYDGNDEFQEWDNYGKIRSTSDHLPLVFEL